MKVSDIMQRQILTVGPNTKLSEVGKMIFGLQIAGVPVVQGKKLVGLITQTDILHKLYPSYREFMEDYVHASSFEAMEEIGSKLLDLPASDVMNKNVTTVLPDTPVMRVQSYMLTKGFGRVPVIDKRGNLVGIVSQGDIFRAVVGQKIPIEEEEGFYDWLARFYDLLINWEKRLPNELQSLNRLFRRENVHKVLDFASSTGEHAIGIAENGFEVVGLEASTLMYKIAQKKRAKLGNDVQKKLQFYTGNYKDTIPPLPNDFSAAIFMGNALPHVINTDRQIMSSVVKKLGRHAILVFQIANFEKILKNDGFREFLVRKSKFVYEHEHAFLTFYSKGKGKLLMYNHAIFDRNNGKWLFHGLNTTSVLYIDKAEITGMLRKVGFSKLSFSGSILNGPLFEEPFNSREHDWLNVVAIRGGKK